MLDISNGGSGAANFAGGNSLLLDLLPSGTPAYPLTAGVTITGGTVMGTVNCTIIGALLDCIVGGGGMTIGPGASLRVTIANINAGIGTFSNGSPASCRVDTFDVVAESDETNNNCNADTVIVSDLPPTVSATVPANGAVGVAAAANLTVTFSEPVNVAGNWFQINCAGSGLRNVADTAVSGGPTTWTIDPNADFTPVEVCTATIFAAQVTDQDFAADNMAADYTWSFTVGTPPSPPGGGGGGGSGGGAAQGLDAANCITIDVEADREVVATGDPVRWTLTVRNVCQNTVDDVVVSGLLPGSLSPRGMTTSREEITRQPPDFEVRLGTMQPQETVEMWIDSLVLAGAGFALPEGAAAQSAGEQICLTGLVQGAADTDCVMLFPDSLPSTGGQPVDELPIWVWVVAAGALILGMGGYALKRRSA